MITRELLAAAVDAGTDVTSLINLGAVGVVAGILIVFARGAYQDAKNQRDAAIAEVARLNAVIQDKVIDAITSVTRTVEAVTRSVDDSKQQLLAITSDRQQLRLELEEMRIRAAHDTPRPRRGDERKDGGS